MKIQICGNWTSPFLWNWPCSSGSWPRLYLVLQKLTGWLPDEHNQLDRLYQYQFQYCSELYHTMPYITALYSTILYHTIPPWSLLSVAALANQYRSQKIPTCQLRSAWPQKPTSFVLTSISGSFVSLASMVTSVSFCFSKSICIPNDPHMPT